jgi:uncharacterized protein YbaP (TraB family)
MTGIPMRFIFRRSSRPLLLALLAASAFAVNADSPRPTLSQPPVPLLWKVSDADNAVYLLGSFHLLKPADYPLSKDVDAAFADAESLVFEMTPEEMASPALGVQIGQAALRTDGTRLDSELPPKTAALLEAWVAGNAAELRKTGMTAQTLQMFEPWYTGLMVSIVEMTKQGLDPRLGLDSHFAERATQAQKPTAGLETGAEQIAFLDGMGKDEQLQFLAEALAVARVGWVETAWLHNGWRAGVARGLWHDMGADMKKEYPRLYQRINVARNDAWVPKLEQRLRQPGTDDTLVVVGALHLLGPDGVVEKLRAHGYKVERICSACATPLSPKGTSFGA